MGCDHRLFHLSYIDNELHFRPRMNAMEFEGINSVLDMKPTLDNYPYPQWLGGGTDVIDGYFEAPAYDTTPPQSMDSAASQFFPSGPLTAQPPPPPVQPSVNDDDSTYIFTIELPREGYGTDDQFSKQQLYSMDISDLRPPEATPSTVPQVDHDPSDEIDHEEEVARPRPSRQNSKQMVTPGVTPQKGNNPFGSKGTRTCAQCRRRKGKVLPHEPTRPLRRR